MQPKLETQPENYVLKASNLTQYQNCTVDPRHSRDVHCPNLNACLINENRNERLNCNTVHFGYAIPVNVVQKEGGFAQLILESGELSEGAVRFLGQAQKGGGGGKEAMATAVNNRRKFPPAATEPEEDIAAIAKQISDHAEAIYQNWKSRGLAPTEILSCNNLATAEKFGSTLTPKKPVEIAGTTPNSTTPSSSLEQLVNDFVVEDKARLAAARQHQKGGTGVSSDGGVVKTPSSSPSPTSSVQYAKEKFDRKASPTAGDERVVRIYSKSPASRGLSRFPMDTIETTLPEDVVDSSRGKRGVVGGAWSSPFKPGVGVGGGSSGGGGESLTNTSTPAAAAGKPRNNEYLDEVAKEEERLINALKTGMIIAEEPPSESKPSVGILEKKSGILPSSVVPPKERPTGLVKRVVKSYQEQAEQSSLESAFGGGVNRRALGVGGGLGGGSLGPRRIGSESPAPHPELTGAQKQHLRANAALANQPVRPFLTRGSVAERVLIFEKCPTELGLDKRKPGISNYSRESLQSQRSGPPPHTTLQRHAKANKSLLLPRFYFPHGKITNQTERHLIQDAIRSAFHLLQSQQITLDKFAPIAKACGCPLYWKAPLFIACGGEKLGYVELSMILDYWRDLSTNYHDPASRFLHILTRGNRNYLLPEDFMSLVQDLVDTHPGLVFLKEAVEFHSRYVHTVISRIFYNVNSSWSGKISLQELRRSNLLSIIALLEKEEDINQITQYFSYEHFYVIYCKFWELDRDHDLFIDKHDLARHSDHALSTRIIDRIFSGAVTRGKHKKPKKDSGIPSKMSYTEFVWFLLAEEDKAHPRAIEYWFRCMDLDGDGYLSMYELEYFYDEQLQRMEAIGIECLPFEDCLCQMLDMIRPTVPGKISLSDLKKCKMTPIFFDTFFNLEKYLDHEQRDPFASQRDHESEMSDWDRYAAEEYELLVAEEGGSENQEAMIYECTSEEDMFSPNLDEMLNDTYINNNSKLYWNQPNVTVTPYDDLTDSGDYADSDTSI